MEGLDGRWARGVRDNGLLIYNPSASCITKMNDMAFYRGGRGRGRGMIKKAQDNDWATYYQ